MAFRFNKSLMMYLNDFFRDEICMWFLLCAPSSLLTIMNHPVNTGWNFQKQGTKDK